MSGIGRKLVTAGLLLLLLGSTTGVYTPFIFAYATSDSMEPSIPRGALYVVYESNDITDEDIIMFRSDYREAYVTHRVIDERDEGYITKGDNNPSTDQRGGAPPVTDRAVVGKVLTVADIPIVIPGAGFWASLIAEFRVIILTGLAGLLTWSLTRGKTGAKTERFVTIGDVIRPLLVIAIFTTVTVMLLVSATTTINFYASNNLEDDSPLLVSLSEETTTTVPVSVTSSFEYTYRFATVDGATLEDLSVGESPEEALVTMTVPGYDRPGIVSATVQIYHYPRVLPRNVVGALHIIHPALAASAVAVVSFIPVYLLYRLLLDPQRPLYSRNDDVSLPADITTRK